MSYIKLFSFAIYALLQVQAAKIGHVDDSNLVHLLTGENNVVVLFTMNNCRECDELESVLENIIDELKNDIGAVVVKAHNSHMVGLYSPSKEPALIYFRRGMPLLYYGSANGEQIVQLFSENREPIVKELSDANFEHLTQAATGATTGDWFLFFYSPDCVSCLRLYAVWEAVGAQLKHRLNVARIDRQGAGITTAKRFGIIESPEFVYIRQGKFYRYKQKEYSIRNLIEFAEKDFMKQTNPDVVPPENDEIYKVLSGYVESIKQISQFGIWLALGVLSVIIIGCCAKYMPFQPSKVNRTNKAKKVKAK